MQWLLHTDPDEIVLPMTGALSLATVLSRQPSHVAAARFLNVEGQPEAGIMRARLSLEEFVRQLQTAI